MGRDKKMFIRSFHIYIYKYIYIFIYIYIYIIYQIAIFTTVNGGTGVIPHDHTSHIMRVLPKLLSYNSVHF